MACDTRTFSVLQGSFLIPVLLIISCFHGIYSQSTLPGNPIIVGEFEKNEGELVTLSCTSVGGNPLPSVQWYKGSQLVDAGSSSTGNGDGVYSVGSSSVTYNNYTFTVSRSDNMVNYRCQVENSQTTIPLTRIWTISVYVPSEQPFITGPEPAITTALDAGNTYKYVCTSRNGRPAPTIRWKLGTSLSTAVEFHQGITENTTTNADSTLSKTSSLSWVPITDDNGKNLYCQTDQITAGSGTRQQSTSVPIVVQQAPILQIGSSSYTVQVGGTVTLACRVLSATPAITNVFWRKLVNGVYTNVNIDNIRFFGGTTSNANLTITNVVLNDQTSYQCSATNAAGTGNSGATTLTVSGTLPTVQVGSSAYSGISGNSVTLVCSIISANPSATSIIWEKDINGVATDVTTFMSSRISGGTISQPSLTISSLTGSDSGTYYCSARNNVGTGSRATTTLTVQSRPIIILPAFTYNANFGQDVTLQCNVSSDSTLTQVTWRKYTNGSPNVLVVTGSAHYSGGTTFTPSLTIRTLSFSDSGNYDCSATNAAGTSASNQMTLNVIGTVPSVNIQSTSYTVTYGGTVTLECVVNSNPFQNFVEWQRIANGVSTTLNVTREPRYSGGTVNSPSLIITGAVSGDAGVYVCSATNDAGKGVSGQTVLTVSGNVPSVSVSQTSYSIFVGSSVTMNCFVSGNPTVSFVYWSVTRNGFTTTASDVRYSNGNVNNPSLTISNARQSDSGVFICVAQNSAGTTNSSAISLTVSGSSPTVSMAQSSYSVLTNGDVTLSCSVSAVPSATISWTFTSNSGGVTQITTSSSKYTLSTSTSASSLTVRTANSNDQGSYVCSARNTVGTGQATATLVVSGNLPTLTLPSTYSAITGNDVVMTCTVSANPAVSTVSWQFQSSSSFVFVTITASSKYSISSTTGTSSLTVRNVASSDNGQYRCQATNQVGTSQSTTTLTVSGSVPTVNIPQNSYSSVTGQDVQIPCSVSANPSASISWTFISTTQSQTSITSSTSKYTFNPTSTDGTLRIRITSSSDSGTYRCQATNAVGTNSDSATLSVTGSAPTVSFGSSTYSVVTEQSIQLSCFVSATPSATGITWTFQSNTGGGTVTITSSTSGYSLTTSSSFTQSTLTVLSAQSGNGGTYTCTATNLVGTRSASASLSVSGSLPTVNIPSNIYSVTTSQDVQIPCSVSASPSATISWTFTSNSQSQITISSSSSKYTFNPTSTDGTLTVRATSSSDSGTYRCQATNAVGTSSDSATLSVSGSLPTVNIPQSSYSVITGSNQQITCFVNANPTATSIMWFFLSSTSGSTIPITSSTSGYSVMTSSTSQSTLTVLAADNNDEGTYTCLAMNQVGNGTDSAFLDVTGSIPVVTLPVIAYQQTYGQNVTMQCSITATPGITSVLWQRFVNGNYLDIQTQSSTKYYGGNLTNHALTITNLVFTDNGEYRCTATNQVGRGISPNRANLQVLGDRPSVVAPHNSYSAVIGTNVSLACIVSVTTTDPPLLSVDWKKTTPSGSGIINVSGSPKYSGSTVASPGLFIQNLDIHDNGNYSCLATNAAGTSESDPMVLTVTGSAPTPNIPLTSYSVLIGNSVQIPCSVTANPAVTRVEWRFTSTSGNMISITQNTAKYTIASDTSAPNLTINSAALSDEGSYVCSATNIVGTGTDRATLTITGNAATVTVSPASQAVIQKNTATIFCNIANANPDVLEVTWEKVSGGSTTPITVTGRFNGSTPVVPHLVISDLQPSDAGTYYCSARNAIGTTRSNPGSILQVTGAVPSNVQISGSTSRTVALGGSLTLQCSAQGDPSPTLTWFFRSSSADATQVGTGTTYAITNAQRTSGGTYTCRASNSLGTLDSNGVNVDVQYAPLDVRTDAQKQVSAAVGSTVTLTCAVDANPSASYQWFRSNVQISTQREYTFTLNNLALLGSYTCRASNSLGTQNLQFTLSQAVSGNTGASTVDSGLSTGEIAAIVLAVLLLLILIIIIIICCLTHGACGVICGKKQDVKGRVEPTKEKEVYKETQKEVIIPRFHEESIKGKRQPSAVSRKDVDVRVQNGGFRRENDYEIVRYETVPAAPPISTQYISESPRPHHLPALSYTYEDVEKKRKKRRKKKKHHHHRHHHGNTEEVVVETLRSASPVRIIQEPVEEVVVERVIRSRSASPTRIIRTEAEEPTIIETRRTSSRSPQRYRHDNEEEMIIERRSPSTKRRHEENYITEERYSTGDDGDLRAINGVVYHEAPSRHSGGRYTTHHSSSERRSRSGRRDRGSDDDLEVVYGKEYVVER